MRFFFTHAGITALLLLCCLDAAADANAASAPADADALALQILTIVNQTSGAIDLCTAKYLEEYPQAIGKAVVATLVSTEGKVKKVDIQTQLEGARHLRPCLANIAKTWIFPAPAKDEPLELTVPVQKGQKFHLPMPGEKPAAEPAAEKKPEGFVRFNKWMPPQWQKKK